MHYACARASLTAAVNFPTSRDGWRALQQEALPSRGQAKIDPKSRIAGADPLSQPSPSLSALSLRDSAAFRQHLAFAHHHRRRPPTATGRSVVSEPARATRVPCPAAVLYIVARAILSVSKLVRREDSRRPSASLLQFHPALLVLSASQPASPPGSPVLAKAKNTTHLLGSPHI